MSNGAAVIFEDRWGTIVIARGPVGHMQYLPPVRGAEVARALRAHLSAHGGGERLAAFWAACGGNARAAGTAPAFRIVEEVAAAVDSGRLTAWVLIEPSYRSMTDRDVLRMRAQEAVNRAAIGGRRPAVEETPRKVADMDVPERFIEVFRRTLPLVGPESYTQFRDLITDPKALGLMVGTLFALAQLQAVVGAGQAVDAVILAAIIAIAVIRGYSFYQALRAAYDAVENLVLFIVRTLTAKVDRDLDEAAQRLAGAVAAVGVSMLSAVFTRIAGKMSDAVKKRAGRGKVAAMSEEEVARGKKAAAGKDDNGGNSPKFDIMFQDFQKEKAERFFTQQMGLSKKQAEQLMKGIDFSKEVEIVDIPPPETMTQMVRKSSNKVGNWFNPDPDQTADMLGLNGNPKIRETKTFKTPKGKALRSVAAPIVDDWTDRQNPRRTKGGGVQMTVPDDLVSQFKEI